MKTMNVYWKPVAVILMLITFSLGEVSAQPALRNRSRKFIKRTSTVIMAAKKDLQQGKIYTGDFARAVAHQRYARKLFMNGFYQKAIYHSHRARMLAFAVIRSNKGVVNREWELDKDESRLPANQPGDRELDQELVKDNPSIAFDDRIAVQAELKDIDVK